MPFFPFFSPFVFASPKLAQDRAALYNELNFVKENEARLGQYIPLLLHL